MYFIAVTLVCFLIAACTYKTTTQHFKEDKNYARNVVRNGFFLIAAFFLISAPFFNTMWQANSQGVSTQTNDFSVWLLLVGGVVLLVACVTEFKAEKRNKRLNNLGSIITIQIYLWVGLYSAYAAIDHLTFADKNFGVMSTQLIKIGHVDDVICDKPLVFINFIEGEHTPLKWRCPEFFVLNGLSSKPFLPWPNYTQGESQKMADALYQFVSEARENTQKQMQSNE